MTKQLKTQNNKNYIIIVFALIWLLVFVFKIKAINSLFIKSDLNDKILMLGVYVFTFYFVWQLIWLGIGETIFILTDDLFIVKSGIPYLKVSKEYSKKKMKNIHIKSDIDSHTYWGFQGLRFFDSKRVGLAFMYENQQIILGENLPSTKLDNLIGWFK